MTDGLYATIPYPLGWGLGRGHVAPRDAWTDVGLDTQFGVARGAGKRCNLVHKLGRLGRRRPVERINAARSPSRSALYEAGAEPGRIARDGPIVNAPGPAAPDLRYSELRCWGSSVAAGGEGDSGV